MFDDIPEVLNRSVLNAPKEFRAPHILFYLAAASVLMFYLQTDFSDSDDALLKFDGLPDEGSWEYDARIAQIADALLSLRHEPGFPDICRRLNSRKLRSAFFEAMAAKIFQSHGFTIHVQNETGVLGRDFDFSISAPDVLANVEVTAPISAHFDPNSLRNSLGKKRRQLPADAPAIIVCCVPGAWRQQAEDLSGELRKVVDRFLRGTGRINYVFLVEDIFLPLKNGGGAVLIGSQQFKNGQPRHSSAELDKILDTVLDVDSQTRTMLSDPNPSEGGVGPLHEWINWLLRRESVSPREGQFYPARLSRRWD